MEFRYFATNRTYLVYMIIVCIASFILGSVNQMMRNNKPKFIKQFNPNVHTVYNGFDDRQFYPEDIRTDAFQITYIGSLFEWQQSALQQVQWRNHEPRTTDHEPRPASSTRS